MLRRLAVPLAALLLLAPLAAAKVDSETKALPYGQFFERNLDLPAGARVPWNITVQPAGRLAAYNIHTHEGADAQPRDLENGIVNGSLAKEFVAPNAGTFSWMVTNGFHQGENLTVTIATDVPTTGSGTPGPGPLVAAGALGLAAALLARRRR